ncbi:putative Late embryogenesis abundant protein, LEA-14 [Rosa chinensis]|uniref:Putative Late embryogenesis abundant protein, LEA-14 n=1 Tax=Rosa chinensis TaxID=74649 RepID=A0A2P6QBU4_ROSCH|nr:protein NDR1 [Rosa chinensis]PRQ31640.1 putative Late embryogenesis abundant protein, LEA-14 [Rosa chinensis]
MGSSGGGCCQCCFSFIFTVGLTALFMWLSLRTSKPSCSIQYFYLPALNKTLNDTGNRTLYVSLSLKNGNKDKGIYYDNVNLNFSLPNTSKPVGNASIPKFYQGHKKRALKKVDLGSDKLNWTAVSGSVYPNGSTYFRVDLETKVRFKIIFWRTKRHKLKVGADVEVNASGTKVNKKDVKLSAADHQLASYSGQLWVLLNFLVFILLNPW